MVGRAYLYGLGAAGERGVDQVLAVLARRRPPHDGADRRRRSPTCTPERVDEVLIADPATKELWLFVLADHEYRPAEASTLLDVTLEELHAAVDWPD